MKEEKQDKTPSGVIRSIFVLLNFILLLAIVVKKITVASPGINAFGWVLLFAVFISCIFCAIYLANRIKRAIKINEDKADWVAVILVVTSVLLLGYLFWDQIKVFLQ